MGGGPLRRRLARVLRMAIVALGAGAALLPPATSAAQPLMEVAHLDGEINSVMASYLSATVSRAGSEQAAAIVIVCDTPGGISSAMDDIVRSLLQASVPVIVFVSPAGARADSAGLFVGQAADVLAMAPGTNIGSAHPISSSGANIAGDLKDKVVNDAVTRIRALATMHGRNPDWAESAVRSSVNIGAEEAVRIGVADIEALDLGSLLSMVDGRTVRRSSGPNLVLSTAGARLRDDPMSPLQRVLHALMDPNVAYLLMLVAVYGLIAELTTPGAILPGTFGVIAGVLALTALSSLPINIGGLLLMLFAFALLVADLKAQTHGILTAGGILALVLGSALLFDTSRLDTQLSPPLVAGVTLSAVVFFAVALRKTLSARARPPAPWLAGNLAGAAGVAVDDLAPVGMVRVGGSLWRATANRGIIPRGTRVCVVSRSGLLLTVDPADDSLVGSIDGLQEAR